MMFYKHWKKIALALTGFFWVSCDDSVSSEECLYGPPSDYGISSESESVDEVSSSSAKAASSATVSSSESAKSSSSKQKSVSSSSGGEEPQGIVACYDVSSDRQTLVRQQNNGITFLSCDDGTTCQEKVIEADVTAPDCEVTDCAGLTPSTVVDTVYYCTSGEIYTPEEFKDRYTKVDKDAESSSSGLDSPIAVYGSPCYFSGTCDTEEDN
jgi:hypothetical protein